MRCLLRLLALSGLLVAAACGASSGPTTPMAPAAAATNPLVEGGTWTIYANVDACADARNECPTFAVGTLVEIALRTMGSGGTISGVASARTPWMADLPVLVSGQLQPDGGVRLTGSYDSGDVGGSFRIIEADFLLRPDDRTGLAGRLSMTERRPSSTRSVDATVLSAGRQPFGDTARAFQGAFDGFGTLRACDGTCPRRQIGERIQISLRLSQAGSTVTGDFFGMPLSGSLNGNTLTLSGERRSQVDEGLGGVGTTFSRIEAFSATVDAVGRLTGTMRLYNEGLYDTGPGAITIRTPFTESLTIDLTTVIRQ